MIFKVKFTDDKPFHVSFGQGISFANHPEYDGEYEVVPKARTQTLNTQNTYLKENVHVLEIPYHEVSNEQNGVTAVIGGI